MTLWYVLIIFFISSLLSGLYYLRTIQILTFQTHRIERRFDAENFFPPGFPRPDLEFIQTEFALARRQLISQIITINLFILSLSGLASFFLATVTLRPIQEALEEQKRFVADAAHELKTPITALKTSLEVNLMDKKTPKSAQKILKDNLVDVNSLESLTKSLLTLASFDRHQPFVKRPVLLKNIINRSLRHISALATQKKIKIIKKISTNSHQIYGDENSLVELLIILLDNAVKYSPARSRITLVAKTRAKMVNLSVSDHGIGISLDHLPHIFDRFYQIDQSRSKSSGSGYGLGLSVAKTIASSHQGHIFVKSKLGSGTTFTVSLPLS